MSANVWPRRIAIVAALVVAGYGGCKAYKKLTRTDANKALEVRQDNAREKIGTALDDVFEAALDADENTLALEATLSVATDLRASYTPGACADGFQEAFEEVLGPDVLKISADSYNRVKKYPLVLDATVQKTDREFVLANSRTPFPGIQLVGDVKLAGKTVHVEVEPGSDISFEYSRMSLDTRAVDASEVAAGLMQATCKEAGYDVLEKLTTWKRPTAKSSTDPMGDCERGFRCVESGDALAEKDPATAEKLYVKACQEHDAQACSRLASVVAGSPEKTDHALAFVTLQMECVQDLAAACVGGAMVAQIPRHPNDRVSDYQRKDALVMALRGCDLGERDGCEIAAPLVKGTPFAEAAPWLVSGEPVVTKKMGTLFGLKWGQWTKMDGGQATMWVTKRPPNLPAGAIVREFSAGELPKGISAPANARTVYAVALDGVNGGQYDGRCETCRPSGGGGSIYSMRALDCVCVISPP